LQWFRTHLKLPPLTNPSWRTAPLPIPAGSSSTFAPPAHAA
jgi:hypothetical protein